MSQITKPLLLNETGQAIVTALGNLTSAVQPTNIYEDISVSLPANGWTNSAPYTYTWTSSKVTSECGVEVGFEDAAKSTGIMTLTYEKVAGGIQFTAPSKPSVAIPVTVRIINADAESITSLDAEMVSTNAISGASNVQQALGTLNSKTSTFYRYSSEKTTASFPTGLFLFEIMDGTTIGNVTVQGNCRGIAANTGSSVQFIVSNVTGYTYSGGYYQTWAIERLDDYRNTITLSAYNNVTILHNNSWRCGNIVHIEVDIETSAAISENTSLLNVPSAYRPDRTIRGIYMNVTSKSFGYSASLGTTGEINQYNAGTLASGSTVYMCFDYYI